MNVSMPYEAFTEGPSINWKHIDGPLMHWAGHIHWLTFRERIRFALGFVTIDELGCARWPHLAKARAKILSGAPPMTDDLKLVERLRAVDHESVEDCFMLSPLFEVAASAIERLVRERDEARERAVNWEASCREAYADLGGERACTMAAEADRDRQRIAALQGRREGGKRG